VEWLSLLPLYLMVALMSSRRLRFVPLFVLAAVVATVTNISWLLPYLGAPEDSDLLQVLTQPSFSVVGNGLAGALAIWGLVRLARSGSSREKMARSLIRRRDYYGAAEIYLQMGSTRRALELFRRGRAWSRAAEAALDLGLEEEALHQIRLARELTVQDLEGDPPI